MFRVPPAALLSLALASPTLNAAAALGQEADPAPEAEPPAADRPAVGFFKDVAPILLRNCVGCHNAKKAESKYDMSTFNKMLAGGVMADGEPVWTPGEPDESYFVELIRHDGQPRMPYKLDPLPLDEIALIEAWIAHGARYDAPDPNPDLDWTALYRKHRPVEIPESYPIPMPITALAFLPAPAEAGPDAPGVRLLSSGYHETLVWNPAAAAAASADGGSPAPAAPLARLRGVGERIHDLEVSPDGKFLAVASGDPGQSGAVDLFSVAPDGSIALARRLLETTDTVHAVAFSPDGATLATGGADRAIVLFAIPGGEETLRVEDHADWVFDVAFSPDGKFLASASRDKTAKVFDLEKRESLATFPGHAETVFSVAFLADGKTVASAGGDNRVRFWNPFDDAKQLREAALGAAVFKLVASPDRKLLAAAGADRVVRLVNPDDAKVVKTLEGMNDWIYALAFRPDGARVAAGAWDGRVRLWTVPEGEPAESILAAPGAK